MKISENFQLHGTLIFRYRGYLALLLFPFLLMSFIGFTYPYGSHRLDLLWEIGCFLISVLGLAVRILTSGTAPSGTSGRNTRQQKAEVLNTTGMYSIVRHPLYLGNYLIVLGISLFPRTWFLPILASLAFILCYERIIFSEEKFLESKFGEKFRAWAAKVPAVIPKFRDYKPSALPCSLKAALGREFYALFGIIATFFGLDIAEELIAYGRIELDPIWTPLFIIGLFFFLVMRTLKKKRLLKVNER